MKDIEYWIGVVRSDPKNQLGCLKIYNQYQAFVRSILVKMLKSPDTADGLVSIVFMKVYDKLTLYESHTSFKAWIHRLTVNTAIDFLRLKKDDTIVYIDDDKCFLEIPTGIRNPEESMINDELSGDIDDCLNLLTPIHREVLSLRYKDGMAYEDISEKLSIPIGTVKSRLSNGKREFQKQFQTI